MFKVSLIPELRIIVLATKVTFYAIKGTVAATTSPENDLTMQQPSYLVHSAAKRIDRSKPDPRCDRPEGQGAWVV